MTAPESRKHSFTEWNGKGLGYLVRCSCGNSLHMPTQNALARAAKVRGWKSAHLRRVATEAALQRAFQEEMNSGK